METKKYPEPQIRVISERKLIGIPMNMSLADNRTVLLWATFMPRRKEILNSVISELYSLQIYPKDYFLNFNPAKEFEKWAAIEVTDFASVPKGMMTFNLQEGLYSVFNYKGLNTDHRIFEYIFSEWIPTSGYQLDSRPHFELLGNKYRNGDPESEEEIWIPVKMK